MFISNFHSAGWTHVEAVNYWQVNPSSSSLSTAMEQLCSIRPRLMRSTAFIRSLLWSETITINLMLKIAEKFFLFKAVKPRCRSELGRINKEIHLDVTCRACVLTTSSLSSPHLRFPPGTHWPLVSRAYFLSILFYFESFTWPKING